MNDIIDLGSVAGIDVGFDLRAAGMAAKLNITDRHGMYRIACDTPRGHGPTRREVIEDTGDRIVLRLRRRGYMVQLAG